MQCLNTRVLSLGVCLVLFGAAQSVKAQGVVRPANGGGW